MTDSDASSWSITKRFELSPVPWSRPRANSRGGGKPVMFNSSDLRRFMSAIGLMARVGVPRHLIPAQGPVRLDITFYIKRPASVSPGKRPLPDVKPDLSNLVKAVEDGLNGIWFEDDAQVVDLRARKRYTSRGVVGGAIEVTLSPVISDQKERTS